MDDGYEHYRLRCTFEGNGQISDVEEVLWKLTTLERRSIFRYGVLSDPICSFSKPNGGEYLLVTRRRQFLFWQSQMRREEELVCTITQRSVLRNKYLLEFAHGASWTFHMPLFAVFFQGASDTGRVVQVREWSKRQWFIRVRGELSEPLLPCALLLVQRERLRSG